MKRLFILTSLTLLFPLSINAQPPKNFSMAKKEVRKLFSNDRRTLYCNCKFDKYNRIDLKSCHMQQASSKKRAHRVEAEHIMPASTFGRHFACWREKLCTKKKGKKYKGRKCCEKIDSKFKRTEAELYNLWPANGLTNGARSNYKFSSISGNQKFYGCNFKIQNRSVEPSDQSKGIVARANLFMSDKYNINLSKAQRNLFNAWNKKFKPTIREINWSEKVARIEGYYNPYIKGYK